MRQPTSRENGLETRELLQNLFTSTEDLLAHTIVAEDAHQALTGEIDKKNQKYSALRRQLETIIGRKVAPIDSDFPGDPLEALEQWQRTAQRMEEDYQSAQDSLQPETRKQYEAVLKQIDSLASQELSSAEAKTYALLFGVCTLLWLAGGTFQTITSQQYDAQGVSQLYNFFQETLGNQTAEFMLGQLGVVGEPISIALIVNRIRHNEKSREEILKSIRFFSILLLLHELVSFGSLVVKNTDQTFYPDVKDVVILSIPVLTAYIYQKIAEQH